MGSAITGDVCMSTPFKCGARRVLRADLVLQIGPATRSLMETLVGKMGIGQVTEA